MNVENLSDELLVHHLEGVISKLNTDVQAENLIQKAEEDELERSQRWIKDDDHLQEEEDKLNSSLALLQDELHQIKPDTPLLDRSAKDLQDLIFPERLGDDVDLARLGALSPLSLDGFMDESLEWNAEHGVDAVSDANAELFRALDLEFKQIMLLDGNSAAGDTPLSNTPTDALVSPHTGANDNEATPTTTTSRHRPVRRVDPSLLEGDFRNVVDASKLTPGEVAEEYAGLFGLTEEAESVACVRLFECILRPDVQCRQIMHSLYPAFESQGLVLQETQGSHVVLQLPTSARNPEWHFVDVQIGIQRRFKQRALVCRFLKRLSLLSDSSTQQTMGPQTRVFIEQARHTLVGNRLTFSCLYEEDKDEIGGLDKQFLTQLEGACRDKMYASFKESITPMEDHARGYEWKCARLMSTLESSYKEHNVKLPDLSPVPDIHEYPLDALSIFPPERSPAAEDAEQQQQQQSSLDAVAYILMLQERCWAQVQRRCDAELTARITRYNTRIMDRIDKAQAYKQELLQRLLDHPHAANSALTQAFRRAFQDEHVEEGNPAVFAPQIEVPVYHCMTLVNSLPMTMYVTGNFLCFIAAKVLGPFVPKWSKIIPIAQIQLVKKVPVSLRAVPNTVEVSYAFADRGPHTYHFTPAAVDSQRVIEVITEMAELQRTQRRTRDAQQNAIATHDPKSVGEGYTSFEPILHVNDRTPLIEDEPEAQDVEV